MPTQGVATLVRRDSVSWHLSLLVAVWAQTQRQACAFWQTLSVIQDRGMAAYEDLKSATEGWYCRPLPAPMVTGVLPRGELEPFLELTSDIGANENPLVHYIDFITGHRDPVPPELDEQYKAAWKDDNYHNLPPPFGFKTAPPHHMTLQICIFDAPDGTKTIIKHCVIPNKAKTAVFASMAFGSVKKLCFQHPKVHD